MSVKQEYGNDRLGKMLQIVTAPISKKGVYALKDITLKELTLVPLTTAVAYKGVVPKDAIVLHAPLTTANGKEVRLVLLKPKQQAPQVATMENHRGVHAKGAVEGSAAHYWLVEETEDPKTANLSIEMITKSIKVGGGGAETVRFLR